MRAQSEPPEHPGFPGYGDSSRYYDWGGLAYGNYDPQFPGESWPDSGGYGEYRGYDSPARRADYSSWLESHYRSQWAEYWDRRWFQQDAFRRSWYEDAWERYYRGQAQASCASASVSGRSRPGPRAGQPSPAQDSTMSRPEAIRSTEPVPARSPKVTGAARSGGDPHFSPAWPAAEAAEEPGSEPAALLSSPQAPTVAPTATPLPTEPEVAMQHELQPEYQPAQQGLQEGGFEQPEAGGDLREHSDGGEEAAEPPTLGLPIFFGGEGFRSGEGDSGEECGEAPEWELTEEWKQRFEQQDRRRKQARRKTEGAAARAPAAAATVGGERPSLVEHFEMAKLSEAAARLSLLGEIYGEDGAAHIADLEAEVDAAYDAACGELQPPYWPCEL